MKLTGLRTLLIFASIATTAHELVVAAIHEKAGISDEFVDYIKAAANPELHGVRKDGRFYPYSSPEGRRIGYQLKVPDKGLYAKGWSAAQADQALRDALTSATNDVWERVRREFRCNFDELPQASREPLAITSMLCKWTFTG